MRSRVPDRQCAEATELALAAARAVAGEAAVGDHLGVQADGDRVVTHFFACADRAYRGWRWAVTVARASRSRLVTLDETVLLPDGDAVLAPQWVPWSERLRPGDMGPGDLLPSEEDDPRLEPGYTGGAIEDPAEPLAGAGAPGEPATSRGSVAAIAAELGIGRPRVLSREGLLGAAERWDEHFGPDTAMAQAAPAPCASCGYLLPVGGALRQAFGVCANEFSPADGRMVSLGYGCGAHSEAAVMPAPPRPAELIVDELKVDQVPDGREQAESRPDAAGAEE